MLYLSRKIPHCLARATLYLSDTLMMLVLHAVILGMSTFPLLALKKMRIMPISILLLLQLSLGVDATRKRCSTP
jgi:hypothetical protein